MRFLIVAWWTRDVLEVPKGHVEMKTRLVDDTRRDETAGLAQICFSAYMVTITLDCNQLAGCIIVCGYVIEKCYKTKSLGKASR